MPSSSSSCDSPPSDACSALSFSRAMTLLFAVAAGISVANVYYAHPLLDALAADFQLATAGVGMVVCATQLGSVLALMLLVPLGDLLPRRGLLLWQAALLAGALLMLVLSTSGWGLLAAMLTVGMLGTAMTQGLIAYAATLAPLQERGTVVGTVQAGVVIGLLLARVVSGALADIGGWRLVYVCSALAIAMTAFFLQRWLPSSGQTSPTISVTRYTALLRSMGGLLLRERTLQIRGVLALLMFAAFNIFWSALVLPLSVPPHAMSHGAIGAFGLVGVVGVLGAARAGHWADRGWAQRASGAALLLLALSWLPLAWMDHGLWALIAGILLLDLGGQMVHVLNQSLILRTSPDMHSRMIACYMLFYAVGSGAGALAATHMYAFAGWHGVCLLGAGVSLAALLWWAATLRKMPR